MIELSASVRTRDRERFGSENNGRRGTHGSSTWSTVCQPTVATKKSGLGRARFLSVASSRFSYAASEPEVDRAEFRG